MGLFQRACETYDNIENLVGVMNNGHATLAPVGHTLVNSGIEIKIDKDGHFKKAVILDKNEPKIVIPVTEESAGRTSVPCPHPLCDRLYYILPDEKIEYGLYVKQLEKWVNSPYTHATSEAVLKYVKSQTVYTDIRNSGIKNIDKIKTFIVRWVVNDSPCWLDKSLSKAFSDYRIVNLPTEKNDFCFIDGKHERVASQHPKGVVAANGNAKLISSNDSRGFTYRGRFSNAKQALSVGYVASQKAHNALRWLSDEYGVNSTFGGRVFLCWNPKNGREFTPIKRLSEKDFITFDYGEYIKNLSEMCDSFKNDEKDDIITVALDAATKGRLSVTYYREMKALTLTQNIFEWESRCCWYDGKNGIRTPSITDIVSCAFGFPTTENGWEKLKTDADVMKKQAQIIINCRANKIPISQSISERIIKRASMAQMFKTPLRRKIAFVACALINQSYFRNKGEICMKWTLDRRDRSFQFGRLLATTERTEELLNLNASGDAQMTVSMQMMSKFRQNPFSVYELINRNIVRKHMLWFKSGQIKKYRDKAGEILEILRTFPESELDLPLDNTYLMGYDLQRRAFFEDKEGEI